MTTVELREPWEQGNSRRYGRPWLATVKLNSAGRFELDFIGNYLSGYLICPNLRVGQIVKAGIKDHRGSGTQNNFYRVTAAGRLEKLTEIEAYDGLKNQQPRESVS